MQTFLPFSDFELSAIALDSRRLGKQRVEAYQILRALAGQTKGWVNHPATKMWRGYEPALRNYLRAMIIEWVRRGYKNTMHVPDYEADAVLPPWLGDRALHDSHRSNLKRKDPFYYAHFHVPDDLPYVWPSTTSQEISHAA
jgi:hypothetical protein